ncbi:TPA: hypothetical protein ACGWER_002006 [Streptococcus agalactiae]|nr:hypothetical protein [Streptococcus agalactiae]HEO2267362.1 hypothetical protein [Streptococcus agalactiae]
MTKKEFKAFKKAYFGHDVMSQTGRRMTVENVFTDSNDNHFATLQIDKHEYTIACHLVVNEFKLVA